MMRALPGILMQQGAAAWSPLDLAGLKAWYDASDAATITYSSGTSVSQWDDKSGNGFHATQGTGANQPTTGVTTINGLAVVSWDNSNDLLVNASLTANQPLMVILVGKLSETGNSVYLDANTGSQFAAYIESAGLGYGLAAGATINAGTPDTSAHQVTYYFNGGSSYIRLDGSLAGSAGNGGTNNLTAGIRLGHIRSGLGDIYTLGGGIGELLIVTSPSTDDRDAAEAYLAAKWGTP